MSARFITFEGGEGVGKSTQITRLADRLTKSGVQAVRTREPGGTPKSEAVRSFLLQGKSEAWGPGAEAVLFATARLDHVNALIRPSLQTDHWVLSDRFYDSTRAYQGLTGGVPDKLIDALEILALDGCYPDLTIVLDMDPGSAFARMTKRARDEKTELAPDRFEKEALDWHGRLRQGFLDIARANPDRCVVIAADEDPDRIEREIWDTVTTKFPEAQAAE
ncbi:MAG: dTMP kinase [Alphaproteobacteria bacterium]|nr:dTMP kinase [Alphaproteobacteria bacterium]